MIPSQNRAGRPARELPGPQTQRILILGHRRPVENPVLTGDGRAGHGDRRHQDIHEGLHASRMPAGRLACRRVPVQANRIGSEQFRVR